MLSKIFLLVNMDNHDYARFSHTGTWQKFREFCNECTAPSTKLVEPLQIEWEPGSDKIGDFSWCGYSIVVLDNVKEFMVTNGFESNFGKVEVLKNTTSKQKKNIVPYPYVGPHLNWLIPKSKINLDIERSGLQIKIDCPVCNLKEYRFKLDGIVIPKSEWNGEKIFRINQFGLSAATYVTEEALQQLLSQHFTNLWYKEAGYIV